MSDFKARLCCLVFTVLLMAYAHLEMTALGTETSVSLFLSLCKTGIVLVSCYVVIQYSKTLQKGYLYKYWIFWIFWLCFDFIVLFNGGSGISCMHSYFAPFCFLFSYTLASCNINSGKYIVRGMLALLFLCSFETLFLTITYGNLILSEAGNLVSNLIFWPLSSFVFVALIKKPFLQYVLFIIVIILTLLTAKRSATIIVIVELSIFVYCKIKENRNNFNFKHLVVLICFVVIGSYYIGTNFSSFIENTTVRFESMKDDEGSGRIEIYKTTTEQISEFNLFELLFGRGYGSIVLTKHSNAHNDALQMLYEYGIIGFFFYIFLILFLLKDRELIKDNVPNYYVGYIFCVITIVVLGLVSNLTVFNSYFGFICAYLGLAESQIYCQIENENFDNCEQ